MEDIVSEMKYDARKAPLGEFLELFALDLVQQCNKFFYVLRAVAIMELESGKLMGEIR